MDCLLWRGLWQRVPDRSSGAGVLRVGGCDCLRASVAEARRPACVFRFQDSRGRLDGPPRCRVVSGCCTHFARWVYVGLGAWWSLAVGWRRCQWLLRPGPCRGDQVVTPCCGRWSWHGRSMGPACFDLLVCLLTPSHGSTQHPP